MDILYKSQKLRKTCNSIKDLTKTYGPDQAKVIRRRQDQLRAATCLADIRNLPGHWHELTGDRAGTLAVNLRGLTRMIFEVADEPVPLLDDGGLDWKSVTSIRILEVGVDYHGD